MSLSPQELDRSLEIGQAFLNLSAEEIAETVISLFQALYITITINDQEQKNVGEVSKLKEKIINSINNGVRDSFFYELTAYGGEVWEKCSNPNWDYYIDGYLNTQNSDFYISTLSCYSKATLEKYLTGRSIIPSLDVHLFDLCRPILETVIWTKLGRWNPTYWKTLGHGFQLQYKCNPSPDILYIEDKVMTSDELELYNFPYYLKENWCPKHVDIANQTR